MNTTDPATSFSRGAGKLRGRGCALGDRDMASGRDEPAELIVGYLVLIDPESVDNHPMNRSGIVHRVGTAVRQPARVQTTHREFATGNPHHSCRSTTRRSRGERSHRRRGVQRCFRHRDRRRGRRASWRRPESPHRDKRQARAHDAETRLPEPAPCSTMRRRRFRPRGCFLHRSPHATNASQ